MSELPATPAPDEVPHAPWALVGECLVAVARARGAARRVGYPRGIRPLPGPTFVLAIRYTDSPVGPFLELAVARPAALGLRPGFCMTASIVSSPAARLGGRLGWGFPRDVGGLSWSSHGDMSRLRWEERGIEVSGRAGGWPLPFLVPIRSLQRRADGPVVIPGRLRAQARLTRVDVVAPDDDPLAWLSGSHRGMALHAMRMVLKPARRPLGLLSSFGAPLSAAEPALSSHPAVDRSLRSTG
jgi:hypothetical protein